MQPQIPTILHADLHVQRQEANKGTDKSQEHRIEFPRSGIRKHSRANYMVQGSLQGEGLPEFCQKVLHQGMIFENSLI